MAVPLNLVYSGADDAKVREMKFVVRFFPKFRGRFGAFDLRQFL